MSDITQKTATASGKTAEKHINSQAHKGLPFTSLVRSRTAGTTVGGRYANKTRRLTLPKAWGGKSVDASVVNGVLVIGGEGAFSCHPTQHFITLPRGVVEADANITLEPAEVPAGVECEAVAYTLPKA